MRRVHGLQELAGEYGALLCDVWGVLHNGVAAFPAAVETLVKFRETRGPVALITNAPRPSPPIREQLRKLDVPEEAFDCLVTSGDVTRMVIAARPGVRLLHLGPERDLTFYEGLDATLVEEDEAELISCTGLYDDTSETPDDYRGQLARLAERDLVMVCANPDIVVERAGEHVYCAGALARLYREMGGEAVLAGKPHAPIYEEAKRQLSALGAGRVLAIGDGLSTDIRGAVENEIPVLFVSGGIHAADFGPRFEPDAERVVAKLDAEGLSAEAFLPVLRWSGCSA